MRLFCIISLSDNLEKVKYLQLFVYLPPDNLPDAILNRILQKELFGVGRAREKESYNIGRI